MPFYFSLIGQTRFLQQQTCS